MFTIADHDVADPHSHPDPPGAFDLRAANFDRITLPDIVLDRFDQPRCGHVEIDRACAQPDPQGAKANAKNNQKDAESSRNPLDPSTAGQPIAKRNEPIAETVPATLLLGQQATRTVMPGLVMLMIPIGIIPLQGLVIGARSIRLWRLISGHCLSVLALTMRMIVTGPSRIDNRRALFCRHRCQSSV
ncbi:hypothetical protein [Bradyrhizobium sp. NFR13]|uniref:hypothetical protein n=1 Tax=Bradyrhizobium sp. NFR13 TaxID=1566285 RepID=UPI0025700BC0|nr:hypothetical protein [Bradyrhizobium sp. NFR13]